jgi:MoaA/NifB/PqqE/SkfB family radical SAM enzyme
MQTLEYTTNGLTFLWIELTARCNLRCIHCYAESGPNITTADPLTTAEHVSLLDSARSLGCRAVQFIGGEPTLVPSLPRLIERSRSKSFDYVEVFTNATRISGELLSCFVHNRVSVATSFYSYDSSIHDAITQRAYSHEQTVRTLRRLVDAGLDVRVGIIVMEQNRAGVEQTKEFLRSLGISKIGTDRIRSFGRGDALMADVGGPAISELCGRCWEGRLAVAPDGVVSPCIMARAWPIGSIRERTLEALVESHELAEIRKRIFNEHFSPGYDCNPLMGRPSKCWPEESPCHPDKPEPPQCQPDRECIPDSINRCNPNSPGTPPPCNPDKPGW